MKRYIFLFLVLLNVCTIQAQRVRVAAPKHVTVGEEFQVEYTVYTQDIHRFQLGRLSGGLEKVYGPATSSQSNFQFIDGHASSSSSVSFTYVFVATRKYRACPHHRKRTGTGLNSCENQCVRQYRRPFFFRWQLL